ncbi:LamG-like jellyroll fold domain-containing protein [Pseudomonas nicosulfuronedens]
MNIHEAMLMSYSSSVATDPYWSMVSLLMHFEGADNSTTFTDEKGKTVTPVSDVVIKTGQGAFGTAGAYMGGGGYLTIPYSADLSFRSSLFCIESWCKGTATSGSPTLIDFRGNGAVSSGWAIYYDAVNRALAVYDGILHSSFVSPSNVIPAAGTAFSWAVTRDSSGVVNMFINGTKVYAFAYDPPVTVASGIRIGMNQGGAGHLIGYMDELRITKGADRYTSNYTPATSPFPNF